MSGYRRVPDPPARMMPFMIETPFIRRKTEAILDDYCDSTKSVTKTANKIQVGNYRKTTLD